MNGTCQTHADVHPYTGGCIGFKDVPVNISTLRQHDVRVINLDTGEIMGTNLVLVYIPDYMAEFYARDSQAAKMFGDATGTPLLADLEDAPAVITTIRDWDLKIPE